MARIIEKTKLNDFTVKFVVAETDISKFARPGQFVMVRSDADSERIPLTIESMEKDKIILLISVVGNSTYKLSKLEVGDEFLDFYGPFGKPLDLDQFEDKKVLVAGIGRGISNIVPITSYLKYKVGARVDVLTTFESKELVVYEEDLNRICNLLYITTLDGSNGIKAHSYEFLEMLLSKRKYDVVISIGPAYIVEKLNEVCQNHDTRSIVSFNTIMLCGAGICGSCRITVDGSTKFACIDGPFFEGNEVDYEVVRKRLSMYVEEERDSYLFTLAEDRNAKI